MPRPVGPLMDIEELREHLPRMTELARRGAHPTLIAESVGIHRQTWWNWRKRWKEGLEPYVTLLSPVMQARAEHLCEVGIQMHEENRLLPGAWILERNEPGLFAISRELRYPDTDAPTIDDAGQGESGDRIKALARKYAKSGAAKPGHLRVVKDDE